MITFSYSPSSEPLEFLTMIHQVVFDFSFSGCLEMYSELNLTIIVCCMSHQASACPIFALLEVMPRVPSALYLPVAYDDITKQLTNDNYKYFCMSIQ